MSGPRLRHALPVVVSLALVAWLVWRVSPAALWQAASQLAWQQLVPATVAMVLALYLWDAVCLQTLFATPQQRLSWPQALHVRGTSYLAGAINYELGQAALAWSMAERLGLRLLSALSRSVLLGFHDLVVLLSLGLAGALLSTDPRALRVRTFCLIGLAILAAVALAVYLLASRRGSTLGESRLGNWLHWWSWRQSGKLLLLRVVYFGILVVYGGAALAICGFRLDHTVVLSTIPLVMLADGLPSVSGLGTRESALIYLLHPDEHQKGIILALSLIWSSLLIVVRLLIGLVHLWGQRLYEALDSRRASQSAVPDDPTSRAAGGSINGPDESPPHN